MLRFLLILSPAAFADQTSLKDASPHITTFGSARVEVVPDQADITLGITNENVSATAGATATAKAANDVIAEIKAQGIDGRTSSPRSICLSSTTKTMTRRVTCAGPRAAILPSTTSRSACAMCRKLAPLARDLIAKGANNFQGIRYSYSKEIETRKRLKADAIRDAKTEAKAYTDAIGVKLGRTLQIGDDSMCGNEASLRSGRRGSTVKSAVVIPTEAGVEEIRETISVVWEIEGKGG